MELPMIRAQGLGMQFNLGVEKGFSLKQGFINCFDTRETDGTEAAL